MMIPTNGFGDKTGGDGDITILLTEKTSQQIKQIKKETVAVGLITLLIKKRADSQLIKILF